MAGGPGEGGAGLAKPGQPLGLLGGASQWVGGPT